VMSEISRNYSTQATGLLCVVNSSRGVVTLPFREYMGQVPDTLGSANSLFICNKSDQVDLHEKDAVMKNIQKSAKKVWPNLRNDQFFYFDTCKALNFHSKYGIMESEEIKIRHKFNEFLAQNLTERVRYLAECAREEFAFIANFIESLSLDEKKRKRCSIFLRNSKNIFVEYEAAKKKIIEDITKAQSNLIDYLTENKAKLAEFGEIGLSAKSISEKEVKGILKEEINEYVRRWEEERGLMEKIKTDIIEQLAQFYQKAFQIPFEDNFGEIGMMRSKRAANERNRLLAWYRTGTSVVIRVTEVLLQMGGMSDANATNAMVWRSSVANFYESHLNTFVGNSVDERIQFKKIFLEF